MTATTTTTATTSEHDTSHSYEQYQQQEEEERAALDAWRATSARFLSSFLGAIAVVDLGAATAAAAAVTNQTKSNP